MRHSRLTPVLVVLTLLSGCARCGAPRGGPPPERFIPATNAGALIIPVVAEAARQAGSLQGALAARPGGEALVLLRTGLGSQLGFDLFDPASLEAAGLDVKRGLAIGELAVRPGEPGTPLLVLPIGDMRKLEPQVTRLARERLGAADHGEQAAGTATFTVWRRAPGEAALLSVGQAEGSLLLAVGPSGPDVLRVVLALDPAVSLAESPAWKRGRAALGDGFPVLLFAPRDSPALLDLPGTDGIAAGLSATASGARLSLAVMLGAREPQVRPLAGTGDGAAQPSRLDPATVVALRFSVDPVAALRLASEQRGLPFIEPITALAAQLATPIEVGIGLADKADLGSLIGGRALAQPLTVARLEALAGVKDQAAFASASDRLAARLGAPAGAARGRWTVGGGDTEVAWVVRGTTVALTAGAAGGLAPLLKRLEAGAGGFVPPPGATGSLAGGLGGLVLHGDNLVAGLKALPPSAFGAGPDAVVGRSLVEKLVTSLGQGAAVALRADLPAGALKLTLDLKLGATAASPP